jgi:hypothetical protein
MTAEIPKMDNEDQDALLSFEEANQLGATAALRRSKTRSFLVHDKRLSSY